MRSEHDCTNNNAFRTEENFSAVKSNASYSVHTAGEISSISICGLIIKESEEQ
jgi:hypothetical protein